MRLLFGALFLFVSSVGSAYANEPISQNIVLASGWNIISTPMILSSHEFSAEEISDNFDIYLLDASQPSGWATMASLGQTEFTPLYGYFINNKTGVNQTLALNYATNLDPNEKIFERIFSQEGWYSIGVANDSYAKNQGANRDDTNNPSVILNSLKNEFEKPEYDLVIDFTDAEYDSNRKSVALSNPWKAKITSEVNELNDFRETKGYVIYITEENAKYIGLQNDPAVEVVASEQLYFSLGLNNPDATTLVVDENNQTENVKVLSYEISATGGDVSLGELLVNIQTGEALVSDVVSDVKLKINNNTYTGVALSDEQSVDFSFDINNEVVIIEGEILTVEVIIDFKHQNGNYVNGETIMAGVSQLLADQTVATGLDGLIGVDYINGDAIGSENIIVGEGIYVPSNSVQTTQDTSGVDGTTGIFTISFEVTALEDDFYITNNAASSATSEGVKFTVEGGEAIIASNLTSTGDVDTAGVFTINEGETETFTLTVTVGPTVAGIFRVSLDEIWYSIDGDGLNGETYLPAPVSDFRTASLFIQGS